MMISKILWAWATRVSPFVKVSGVAGAGILTCTFPLTAQAQPTPPVEECNQFAEVVNRNQTIFESFEAEINNFASNVSQAETLEAVRSAASQYVSAVDEVTASLDTLVTDLEALNFSDDGLMNYRADYVTVVSGFSNSLDTVGSAMGDVAESESESALAENLEAFQTETLDSVAQVETLAADEAVIISGVNEYCGAEGS